MELVVIYLLNAMASTAFKMPGEWKCINKGVSKFVNDSVHEYANKFGRD